MATQLFENGKLVYDSSLPVSGGLPAPTTQEQFRALVQAAFDTNTVVCLAPSTVTVSSTIDIAVPAPGGHRSGVIAPGTKINSMITNGSDVLRFTTTANARNIVIEGLSIYGGVYDGRASGNGLSIHCDIGKAMYNATLKDLVVSSCGKSGVYIAGDFFESLIDNLVSDNNNADGLSIADGADGGIISDVIVRSSSLSRNHGYGLRLDRANSVDVLAGGRFILNGAGGIFASNGIRTVESVNFENSGLIGIDIPTSDYPSRITGCNASSDESTHDPSGVAMKHTYRYGGSPANLLQSENYYTFYGKGAQQGSVRG